MELSRNQISPERKPKKLSPLERKTNKLNPLYINNTTGEVGSQEDFELKDGRRDWKMKKKMSIAISNLMNTYDPERALNISNCGKWLQFGVSPDGKKSLLNAYFCRERMCPLCQWRRALKLSVQADKLFKSLGNKYRYLFVTLTVRNCTGAEFNSVIDNMHRAYITFAKAKKYKAAVRGAYRALEVTYNAKDNTYHPHFHVIWAVDPDYFDGDKYISQDNLIKMWRKSAKLDYDPSVRVEVVKQKENQTITSACVEMCKYPVKTAEIHTADVLQTIDYALRGRRLISWLGVFADERRRLNQDDIDEGDLIHLNEVDAEHDVVKIAYVWRSGLYLPVDVHALEE